MTSRRTVHPARTGPMARDARPQREIATESARMHLRAGEPQRAIAALRRLLGKPKPGADVLLLSAIAHERCGAIPVAEDHARRSLRLAEHPDALLLLARAAGSRGETDAALALLDRALALSPGEPAALALKASTLEQAGRVEEAHRTLEPLLLAPESGGPPADPEIRALWGRVLLRLGRAEQAIASLDEALGDARLARGPRLAALHVRAKALDGVGDYRGAFETASRAASLSAPAFDPLACEAEVSAFVDLWSRERIPRFPASSCTSELPVFIAGMPRSGTSLIDQIIDAHPRAAGVGELHSIDRFSLAVAAEWDPDLEPPESFGRFDDRAWTRAAESYLRDIRKLAPGAERIVNKSLGNTRLLGFIARLFPNTRVIHAIRDPRDVAVSCYLGGFRSELHPWVARPEWIACAWEQSMRMMEHWKATLDVPILDVHYERLVHEPEREFPRIIEFLGLEWDDACNRFYESRRTVRTLSYDQVNRPLYTSSAGRHANYARFLEGIDFPRYDPFAGD